MVVSPLLANLMVWLDSLVVPLFWLERMEVLVFLVALLEVQLLMYVSISSNGMRITLTNTLALN